MRVNMMKKIRRSILCALALAALGAEARAATSVSRHGITWTFDRDRVTGVYANGDPWVVGPVVITSISPQPTVGRNGSMLNPSLGNRQAFDDRYIATYNPYDNNLNVGIKLPLTVAANSSLISSISSVDYKQWGLTQMFAVLTCVSSAPSAGSFRPAYMGAPIKTSPWNVSSLNFSKLQKLPTTGFTTIPNWATYEADFEKLWFEMDLAWTGRYLHAPYQAANGYGKDMAIKTGDVALMLNMNFSDEVKRKLLINYVQYGIDIAGIRAAGGRWYDTGGHNIGRLAPLMVAATALDDASLKARLDGTQLGFSEYCQTFFVTQADVDRVRYTADGRPRLPYTSADIGMPEWGETHTDNPTRDGNNWNAYYRDICGGQLTAPAMAARVMGIRSLSKWEPMYLYQERHLNYEQGPTYQGEFNYNPTPAFHKQFYNTFKAYTPGSVIAPPPPVVTFAIGDRIELSANTNVRASGALTATLLGTQPTLAKGTIVAGPIGKDANNITWWQINYDTGVDGWSGQDNFVKTTEPPPAPTFAIGDRIELSANTNVRASGALTATLLGTQPALALGTIVGGPIGKDADNITWWQINYDTGVDGWSGQDNFVKTTQPPPAVTFAIGDRIELSANTNVRASGALSATLLGAQPALAKGTIIGGPIGKDADNITWWQMNYDTGVDGWSGQDNFGKIPAVKPSRPTGLKTE